MPQMRLIAFGCVLLQCCHPERRSPQRPKSKDLRVGMKDRHHRWVPQVSLLRPGIPLRQIHHQSVLPVNPGAGCPIWAPAGHRVFCGMGGTPQTQFRRPSSVLSLPCILIVSQMAAAIEELELSQAIDGSIKAWRLSTGFAAPLAFSLRKHRRHLAAGALIAILAASAGWLADNHNHRLAAVAPYPHELAQVSFAVAGDVIPHEPVRAAAAAAGANGQAIDTQGWGALFADVSDVFKKADLGFVNFETPAAPAHSKGSKPFMFDAPIALIDALKANGIKIVSFANNHVMDQGWPGFTETRENLQKEGLLFVGTSDTAAQPWQ